MKKGSIPKKVRAQTQRPTANSEAFSTLVTAQQQQINDIATYESKPKRRGPSLHYDRSFIEEEEQMNISVQQLKKSNVEKMSVLVGQLLAKNKINVKNAFQVPLIHINETHAFTQTSNDNSWKRLSSSLESNNKIYGYRVDATHSYTYRVLESITRQQKKEEFGLELPSQRKEKQASSLNPQFEGEVDECYVRYLEKNYRNLNILHVQTFFNVNPVLQKTKRIFDQNGLRGLLLNNLDISLNLSLRLTLTQSVDIHLECNFHPEQQIQIEGLQFCSIFEKIESICVLNNLIQKYQRDETAKRQIGQIQELWKYFQTQSMGKERRKQTSNQAKTSNPILPNEPAVTEVFQQQITQSNQTQLQLNQIFQKPIHSQSFSSLASHNQGSVINNPNISPIMEAEQAKLPKEAEQPQQSCEISQNNIEKSHNSLISTYIKINKILSPINTFVPEINQRQQNGQENNLVQQWNNPQHRVKKIRKKRLKPLQKKIQFNDSDDGVELKRRSHILALDKVQQKQFKKILKELKIQPYKQYNCQINVSQCLNNFRLKTLTSEHFQPILTAVDQDNLLNNNVSNNHQGCLTTDSSFDLKYGKSIPIRDAKELIYSFIQSKEQDLVQFQQIYKHFSKIERFTPALCFLTILHLSYEKGYSLVQKKGDKNFEIEKN